MRAWMAGVLVAVPAIGQVELAPRLEEGRVDRYRLEAEIVQSQEGEGALGERTLTQAVELRLTTVGVDDEGRAVVSVVVERASAELAEDDGEGGTSTQGFEWPPAEGAEESALSEAWSVLVGTVLRCTVAPDGRVIGVEGSTEGWREGGGQLGLLGVMAPGAVDRTLSRIWRLDPAGEVRSPGDTWEDLEEFAISPGRRARQERAMTLERVEDGRAFVTGHVTFGAVAPTTPTMVELALSGAGSIDATWDLGLGAIESRRERGEMVLEASLGEEGPSVTTTARSRLRIARLGL